METLNSSKLSSGASTLMLVVWLKCSLSELFPTLGYTMNIKNLGLRLASCVLLVCASLNVHAENWVNLYSENDWFPFFVDIDSDSIRKGGDGIVYFNKRHDDKISASAISCKNNIYYTIDNDKKWRSNGVKIELDSNYAIEAEYVCSKT